MAASKQQQKSNWGGMIFAAFVAAVVYAPALAGVVVVAGVLWLIFASNAKYSIGNNPMLAQTGQRGSIEVIQATRSQVRSRTGKGPWLYTWTIVVMAQPPQLAGFRATIYRKIPERAPAPSQGQRFAAWFDKASPQRFHIDWNTYGAAAPSQAQNNEPRPQPRQQQQQRKQAQRPATQPSYSLPETESAPLATVEADGGYGFDFAAHGADARARIDDFGSVDDGSTELALTVMPRGRPAYRTIINTFVPVDRRYYISKGASLRVRIDPSAPGRLMIVA